MLGIDGCKKTLNKMELIKNKYRNLDIWWMSENRGCYVTLNTLITKIKYSNIIIFGSDDIMKPDMVSEIMLVENGYDIVRFKLIIFYDDINTSLRYTKKNHFAYGAIFIKKNVIDLSGGFQENRFSSDAELLKRVADHTRTYFLDKELFYYRKHLNTFK